MRCRKCGFENPDGMKFCGQCTTPLALICPKCSFENPPGFKFCGQCAAPLSAAEAKAAPFIRIGEPGADADSTDGERKTVTALFADIKGSTELMRDLDPEEARAIIDPALQLMIDAVHRYDGYVVQSTGDTFDDGVEAVRELNQIAAAIGNCLIGLPVDHRRRTLKPEFPF
jgi:double zinc ribbon protein/adenylate/guanylate cyclase family protein